ncbi:hypothetical protein scyTo_0008628 [Scyliorhinus torazame]|uniref:Integrase catalytic domain-containing protein n=1 Tax=Scyliorhinus torazame TaxID=75743 RepID=A0A401PC12_SCYTO|nr:hypothetical protein [Scyliorhinus torazame]
MNSTAGMAGPWEDEEVDFLGPLLSGESVLVVTDYYSRYYDHVAMKFTTEKMVSALIEIFASLQRGPEVTLSKEGDSNVGAEQIQKSNGC